MARTAIEEHVFIGSLKVGRGVPNVTLQHKIQAIVSRPFQAAKNSSDLMKKQISKLRVDHLWHTRKNNGITRPIIKRTTTIH